VKWYYFQLYKDGPVIRVKSKQMPKKREKSYIVHEYDHHSQKYHMACFPEIYGGKLLKMIFIGKTKCQD
jgi:hypothetical protein